MASRYSERRRYRRLCRRERQLRRVLTVVLAVTTVVISSFCAAVVHVENVRKPVEKKTGGEQYYAASAQEKIMLHDELNELAVAGVDKTASLDRIMADKEALGNAVENLYAAVAAMNLQKYMMSAAEPQPQPEDDSEELADVLELSAMLLPEDELIDDPTEPETQAVVTEPPTTQAPATEAPSTAAPTEPSQPQNGGGHTVVSSSKGSVELDENGIPVNFTKVLTGVATAYSGDPITATGTVPTYGTVAVNPKIIPYGSLLYIVTADGSFVYGVAKAEDTGGFVKHTNPPIADLYFETEAECYQFGRQNVIVYVIG